VSAGAFGEAGVVEVEVDAPGLGGDLVEDSAQGACGDRFGVVAAGVDGGVDGGEAVSCACEVGFDGGDAVRVVPHPLGEG
jgi:hypothetical protein